MSDSVNGKEAAKHYARLGASTVIIAVRSLEKGEAAKDYIEKTTSCKTGVVQVWHLDLSSYGSVKQFAARVNKELPRVDVLLENAAIAAAKYQEAEGGEMSITVNVTSTFLLAFLLLPKLKDTASKYNVRPVLTIVSSEVHGWVPFKEASAPEGQILNTLDAKKTANIPERYPMTKLLEIFGVQEIAELRPAEQYPVTINTCCPGLCHSELARDAGWGLWAMKQVMARSTEVGSRGPVNATIQGPDTHGKWWYDTYCKDVQGYAADPAAPKTQKRVWKELTDRLEKISPGVTSNL